MVCSVVGGSSRLPLVFSGEPVQPILRLADRNSLCADESLAVTPTEWREGMGGDRGGGKGSRYSSQALRRHSYIDGLCET